MGEDEFLHSLNTEQKVSLNTSVYHIYHTGMNEACYSIHTISDTNTTLLDPKAADAEQTTPGDTNPVAATSTTVTTPLNQAETVTDDSPTPLKKTSTFAKQVSKAKKAKRLDNPKYDPRTETSPYFVHLPILYGHCPPYTLRNGGNKRAPVSCLMSGSWGWRGWKLEFGDILTKEGVMDGRGVVSEKYGTKNGKGGTLKGYKLRKRRYWGESGKKWHNEWKEGQVGKAGQEVKTPKDVEDKIPGEKAKPDEVVELKWTNPFSKHTRRHRFEWREFEFWWKGTRKVEMKKNMRPFLFCNHLKLVVLIPDSDVKGATKQELCLARYICVIGNRKAGRLEVYHDVLDGFLAENVFPIHGKGNASIAGTEEVVEADCEEEKTRKRLRDVVVGTAICMIINERQKRRFILDILEEIAENAGG